jgi:monoamine oxidase
MAADVVVIGAGISGLTCAGRLAGAGLDVIVYEGRDRVGGRIRTFHPADGGRPAELGAQVVHGTRNPVHEIVGEENTQIVSRDVTAGAIVGGVRRDMSVLARGQNAPWALQRQLNVAPGLDDAGVDKWLMARGLTDAEEAAAREWFRQHWAADPDLLSTRAVAAAHRGDDAFDDAEYTVRGGFEQLPRLLARDLEVRTGCPVSSVRWRRGGIKAVTGEEVAAGSAVVVTVPCAVVSAGGLVIEDLPPGKAAAAAALRPGDGYCAVVTFSRPAPDTATVFDADGARGFVSSQAGRPEVLVVAKAGAAATVRHAQDLAAFLRPALPWTAGARVVESTVADWGGDRYSLGAFTHAGFGAAQAAAVWARPVADTLFFAGEATVAGTRLPWVQGAMASGIRAAGQILEVARK